MNTNLVSARGRRGSALLTVLLFTFLLAAIVASMLQWAIHERRMNTRTGYWMEARNASEALVEFGSSQIATQFSTTASPATFDPAGSSPVVLPPTSFFSGGNVDTAAYSTTHPTGVELIAGTAYNVPSSGALYYIDPTDSNNARDTLIGQWVYRRDIQVIARATAVPPTKDKPVTAFVTQTISVRGAPLFSHAIFYSSNDLEIFPGPTMNIYGPVHCNGNMFVSSQGSSLTFNGPVSCTGNLYHAWSNSNLAAQGSGGSSGEPLGQDPVKFLVSSSTSAGVTTYVTKPLDPSGLTTGWLDSTYGADNGVSGLSNLTPLVTAAADASFRDNASTTWKGNLQTGSMGIAAYYPVAFNQIVDGSNHTPDPHVLIDPANGSLATTDPYYTPKTQVENQKMANQAGIYIQVDVSNASAGPMVNIYGPPGSAPTGTPAANIGPNGGIKLVPPANMTDGTTVTVGSTTAYKLNTGHTVANAVPPLVAFLPFRVKNVAVTSATSHGTTTYTTTTTILDAKGTSVTMDGYPSTTTSGSGSVGTTNTLYSNTATSGTSYGYGMYDQRRGTASGSDLTNTAAIATQLAAGDPGATDVVQVNMKALNAAVDSMVAGAIDANNSIKNTDGTLWGTTRAGNTNPDWNGGVYVEVKTSVSPASTPYVSTDYPAALKNQNASVRIVEGTVPSGSSLIPAFGINGSGLTIATNAPAYIMGNFNADGSNTSGDATTPDDGKSGAIGNASAESPVCIAADAITLLSKNWNDTASLKNKNTAADTEYATALLVGLQPTIDIANSGGAHNLPRFLENWSGKTATMRGSLATLYSSKVATQPWSTDYYGAPNRNWGFDQIFKNGNYPPITPKVMSYRRILFTTLSQSAYTTARHNLWPSEF